MLAITVRGGEREVYHRMCLVPHGDYEIVDDWQVLGMRSTGSKSVRATDVFVPEHRALCMYLTRGEINSRERAAIPIRCSACRWRRSARTACRRPASATPTPRSTSRSRRSRSAAPTTPARACEISRRCSSASRARARLFRDQHVLSAHIGFSWDAQGWPWALVAMGGEFNNPTM